MLSVINIGNNRLPETDYRLVFGHRSEVARVTYGIPEAPPGFPPDRWVPMDFREGVRPGDVLEFARMVRWLHRHRDEVDYAHFFATKLVLLGPPLARLAGVRALVTVTGTGRAFTDDTPLFRLARALFTPLLRLSARCSDAVLFQNRGEQELLSGWIGRHAAKAAYIGSAVETPDPPERADDPDRPVRILLVTRIMAYKGVGDFLAAARALAGDRMTFELVGPRSAGQGELDAEVDAADRDGTITYRGPLYGDELIDAYRSADLFFMPSRSEGVARVLLEAGQQGVVPVAYDIPANRDVVLAGCGELLPVGDVDGAIRALRSYAEDATDRRKASDAIRDHCRTAFGMDAYVARMDAALTDLAATRS